MQDDFKQVAAFPEPLMANVAKSRLESAGIGCFLANENTIAMDFFYSQLLGGVRLYVHKEDVGAAESLLAENIAPPLEAGEGEPPSKIPAYPLSAVLQKCPQCHTDNVYSDRRPRTVSVIGFFLGLPIPAFRRQNRCAECGHVWVSKTKRN